MLSTTDSGGCSDISYCLSDWTVDNRAEQWGIYLLWQKGLAE